MTMTPGQYRALKDAHERIKVLEADLMLCARYLAKHGIDIADLRKEAADLAHANQTKMKTP